MKKIIIEPTIKTVLFQSADNSVELYTLTRGEIVETYLRRGGNTELVTGEVDLNFTPEPPDPVMNFAHDSSQRKGWFTGNGINVYKEPNLKAR